MKTTDKVSLSTAEMLHEHGYNKYSDTQFIKNDEGEYGETHMSFNECAVNECLQMDIIYDGTIGEAYDWLAINYPDWNVSVGWDHKISGYYFSVQNIVTGYDYRQPTMRDQKNKLMMYEWGLEHVLNRI